MRRAIPLVGLVGLLCLLSVVPARAELVTVRGGRVLHASSVRYEGAEVILTLRTGGEMRTPRDFVVSVTPDEVPWPEPEPPAPPTPVVTAVADAPFVPPTTEELRVLIEDLADRHGVDLKLAHAVIQVESNYRVDAVSPKGAMGLMQLMPATARQYDVENPFDPRQNVDAGLRHLRGLLDRYGAGSERLALAAYNAGEGAVSRYKGVPPFKETQAYVQRILALSGR